MKHLISAVLSLVIFTSLIACESSKHSNPQAPAVTTSEPGPSAEVQNKDDAWKKEFPAHWWKPVPKEDAKSWEVLPQEAGYKEVVLSKRNELGLLSNFADTAFVYRGVCYATIEGYWQMMKYPEKSDDPRWAWTPKWKYTRAQVAKMDGYKAKSAGNYANGLMDENDANWVTFEGKVLVFAEKDPGEHYRLIWEAEIEKLRQNPEVLKVLLATKDLKLIADHHNSEKAPKEWHYNVLWMEIRSLIQSGQLSLQTSEDLSLRTCGVK